MGFIYRDPKLQVLISDLEVVIRPSSKSPRKLKSRKSSASGRGKWMIVANIARYLSVCVADLVVKVYITMLYLFSCMVLFTLSSKFYAMMYILIIKGSIFLHTLIDSSVLNSKTQLTFSPLKLKKLNEPFNHIVFCVLLDYM